MRPLQNIRYYSKRLQIPATTLQLKLFRKKFSFLKILAVNNTITLKLRTKNISRETILGHFLPISTGAHKHARCMPHTADVRLEIAAFFGAATPPEDSNLRASCDPPFFSDAGQVKAESRQARFFAGDRTQRTFVFVFCAPKVTWLEGEQEKFIVARSIREYSR